jgi:hypothetical protein
MTILGVKADSSQMFQAQKEEMRGPLLARRVGQIGKAAMAFALARDAEKAGFLRCISSSSLLGVSQGNKQTSS